MSLGARWFLLILVECDDKQFHQYQQKSPLTSSHWVMANNSTNINKNHLSLQLMLTITQWVKVIGDFYWYWWNCWPSLNELRWEVVFADIGGIVDHHSMSWGERWWVMVNNSTNINNNHLSPKLIEWWSTIPPISTKITSHLNSLSDGQQFHQYQPKLRWEVVFVDIGGIVDHHSMSWGERWFLLILVELLTIIQWVEVRGDFCWYWWNCWPNINKHHLSL
jgi:hypothetical protein